MIAAIDLIALTEPDAPVSALDEAEAIVACGWRYGSYAYVLCGGEVVPVEGRAAFSWITNGEMKRINLEFSAAVAACSRIGLRIHYASTDVSARRESFWPSHGRAKDYWTRLMQRQHAWRECWSRMAQRSGHRRTWEPSRCMSSLYVPRPTTLLVTSIGTTRSRTSMGGKSNPLVRVPGFARMTAGEVNSVARTASAKLAVHLVLRDLVRPELLQAYMTRFSPDFNSEWSLMEETSDVDYRWAVGAPSPTTRLDELRSWFPAALPSR